MKKPIIISSLKQILFIILLLAPPFILVNLLVSNYLKKECNDSKFDLFKESSNYEWNLLGGKCNIKLPQPPPLEDIIAGGEKAQGWTWKTDDPPKIFEYRGQTYVIGSTSKTFNNFNL